jgi:hypothetical protein
MNYSLRNLLVGVGIAGAIVVGPIVYFFKTSWK